MINLNVPREDVVAFALYTHDEGTLKLSAQLYPLKPDESREVRLELKQGGDWKEIAREEIVFPGWSAHFRIKNWDNSRSVPYRVRHGKDAMFQGLIRKDPVDKDEIVVANMSCNSSRTPGERPRIVRNLLLHDPDLLFFAGDQTYHHTQHTAGWIQFGLQFRDLIKDRPTVSIPDDHDVGQVINETTGEILYTTRAEAATIEAAVYGPGKYTVKAGRDRPEKTLLHRFEVKAK